MRGGDIILSVGIALSDQDEFRKEWGNLTKDAQKKLSDSLEGSVREMLNGILEMGRERADLSKKRDEIIKDLAIGGGVSFLTGNAGGAIAGGIKAAWDTIDLFISALDQISENDVSKMANEIGNFRDLMKNISSHIQDLTEEELENYKFRLGQVQSSFGRMRDKIIESPTKLDDRLLDSLDDVSHEIDLNLTDVRRQLDSVHEYNMKVKEYNDRIESLASTRLAEISGLTNNTVRQSLFDRGKGIEVEVSFNADQDVIKFIENELGGQLIAANWQEATSIIKLDKYQDLLKLLEYVKNKYSDVKREQAKVFGEQATKDLKSLSNDISEGLAPALIAVSQKQQALAESGEEAAKSQEKLLDAAQDWANLNIKKPEIEFDFGIPENALEEYKKKLKKAFAEDIGDIRYAVKDATKNIDQNFKDLDIQPMVIELDYEIPENALKEYKKKLSKIDFAKDLSGFTKTFDSQLKKVFGDDATTVINGFVDLFNKAGGDIETMFTGHWGDVVALSLDALNRATGGSNQALQVMSGAFGKFQKLLDDSDNSMTTLWKDHWQNVVDIGLNALAQLAGGANQTLNSISATFSGAMAGAKYGPWGAIAGGALGFLSSLSSGPSNEELLASQGKKAAQMWGDAFTDEVAQVMASVAEKLPKAASGKVDAVAAMYHPETIAALLKNIDKLTAQVQAKLGTSIGNGVNILMQKMGLTQKQAFEQFVPIFEDISKRIVESGGTLSKPLVNLMQHAKNLGVEFKSVLDIITDSISGVKDELDDLGRQFFDSMVSIDKARRSLRDMRGDYRDAIQQMREIARAPRELAKANQELTDANKALQAAEAARDQDAIDAARKRIDLANQEIEAKKKLGALAVSFSTGSSTDNMTLTGHQAAVYLRQQIRDAANSKESRRGYIRLGQERDLLKQADNPQTKAVIEQLVAAHNQIALQKIQIEDAKKAREIMRTTREQLKNKLENLNTELAKQTAYLQAIADGVGGGSGGVDDENRRNKKDNKKASGRFGFDAIFSGPSSGYTMPVTMHGQERLTITPSNKMAAQQPIVVNMNMSVHADNPVGFRHYLHNGGDVEIADAIAKAVSIKNTRLKPAIAK